MKHIKEEIKKETLIGLKDFLKPKNKHKKSCIHVIGHLENVFKEFDCVRYHLTQEVLQASPDAHKYERQPEEKSLINVENPFKKLIDYNQIRQKNLRHRFVELAIKNLETGKFDIAVELEISPVKLNCMYVSLVVNPNYKEIK